MILFAWNRFKTNLPKYNIFPSFSSTGELYIDPDHILATRIFIIVFITSLILIGLFTLVISVPITVYVNVSTYKEYLNAYDKHGQNLVCPCTSIAVPYSNFMEINVSFHQICKSPYTEAIWISTIYGSTNKTKLAISPYDFRMIGIDIFQAIKLFCQLSNDSVNNELISFYSQEFISSNFIPKYNFLQQINASLNVFIKSMERYSMHT